MNTEQRRKVEITVIDEHQEALLFWAEALSAGKIQKGGVLLHVDAHHDMLTPKLSRSAYTSDLVGFTERQLDIGDFIIPAVMRGIFNEVIFLRRGPLFQKQKRKTKYYIGSAHGEGVWINDKLKLNNITRRLYPDIKPWYWAERDDPSGVKIKQGVLDIDLDYFCSHFTPQPPMGLQLTKPQINFLKRRALSEDKYKINLGFFRIKGKILKAMNTGQAVVNVKEVIYNDSKQWIECAIRYFVESLTMKAQIISICRSVKSGHVPLKYAQFTERTLIRYLSREQEKGIDPCDITSKFEIYPFVTCIDNTIVNPLNHGTINLKNDALFIWKKIQQGHNFPQLFKAMSKRYDMEPELLKREIFRFILHLKSAYVIR